MLGRAVRARSETLIFFPNTSVHVHAFDYTDAPRHSVSSLLVKTLSVNIPPVETTEYNGIPFSSNTVNTPFSLNYVRPFNSVL